MAENPEEEATESPEGAAVFPMIPEELGVHPLLMGLLHAYVFLEGSDQAIVNGLAAEEALNYQAAYLQRLQGADLKRAQEDMATLVAFARSQKWPKQQIHFLQNFLEDNGVGE